MNISQRILALGVASTLASLAACGSGTVVDQRAAHAAGGAGDLVIGVAWPWEARKEMRFGEGLDLAVAEVNAAGGIGGRKLRIERADDHESADEGRAIAQRFGADPNVVAVIGHLQSYVTVPAAAIYDNGGLLMLSPASTDPALTSQGYRRVFRETFTDKAVGHQMAEYAAQHGYRRVAIEYVRDTYGRDLANAFEERATDLGVAIVARQSYGAEQVTEQTFDGTTDEWSNLRLDAVFLAGEVPSAAHFVTSARRAGLTVPILGGDALGTPALVQIAGRHAEGIIVPSVFHADEPRPEVRRFADAFKSKFGVAPDAGTALGYDAIHLLADAMRRAKSAAPEDVAASLHALHEWKGVTGTIAFDGSGDLVDRPVVTMIVRDGRFEYLAGGSAPVRLGSR